MLFEMRRSFQLSCGALINPYPIDSNNKNVPLVRFILLEVRAGQDEFWRIRFIQGSVLHPIKEEGSRYSQNKSSVVNKRECGMFYPS